MKKFQFYGGCLLAILVSFTILVRDKFRYVSVPPPNILIVGCSLESAILVDQLLLRMPTANITLLEEQECQELQRPLDIVDVRGIFYQALERHGFRLDKLNLRVGIWDNHQLLLSNAPLSESIYSFGLSYYSLRSVLNSFANKVSSTADPPPATLEEWLQGLGINLKAKALKYLRSEIGLDIDFIRKIVYPYLYGRTLQDIEMNILTAKLKLLGLAIPRLRVANSQTDLISRFLGQASVREGEAIDKIKKDHDNSRFAIVTNKQQYPNISAVIHCVKSKDSKDGYYVSTVRGTLQPSYYKQTTADLPEQIYSLNNLALISKKCVGTRCRKEAADLYTLHSKSKLSDKDLKMFGSEHSVLTSNRTRHAKYHLMEIPKIVDQNGVFHFNQYFAISEDVQFISAAAHCLALQISKSYLQQQRQSTS